jgi:hypothetical protein
MMPGMYIISLPELLIISMLLINTAILLRRKK